jgi:hypothetical protein
MPHLAAPTTGVRDSFLEAARDLRDEGWLATFPVEKVTPELILFTRADSNTASRRVIEAGGGVRADTIDGVCRYWINETK